MIDVLLDRVADLGLSNCLALLGVALLTLAVGELAGIWWAVLLIGLVLIVMAYAVHTQEQQARPVPASRSTE